MSVSLDHMTVRLTRTATTLLAHSLALASQDFQEMEKYAQVKMSYLKHTDKYIL